MEARGPALLKKARAIDVLTFLAIIFISPASAIFLVPFGVAPQDWFATWQRYVVVFILLAMALAASGFAMSINYKLEADSLERTTSKA